MARQSSAADRWTSEVSEDLTKPTGEEKFLWSAIEKLGPFQFERQEDADARFERKERVSKELAINRTYALALNYNRVVLADRGAPRVADVVDALDKLEKLSGELARYILSLDDITRQRLRTAGSGVAIFGRVIEYPLMKQADADGLPAPAGWNEAGNGTWVERLEALSQYAGATRSLFFAANGISDADAPDKGGNTNLYKHVYGSARWALVSEGWFIYEKFKPGAATGTEGGPFHAYLMDVFEFATGRSAEEHSKLGPCLKQAVKPRRRMAELNEIEAGLIRAQCELDGCKIPLAERRKREEELFRRVGAVEKERYDLWPELYPHTYSSARK